MRRTTEGDRPTFSESLKTARCEYLSQFRSFISVCLSTVHVTFNDSGTVHDIDLRHSLNIH